MSVEELLLWAEMHHYPQLVLCEKDVVRHGDIAWHSLVRSTEERIARAIARVELWQERLRRERGV